MKKPQDSDIFGTKSFTSAPRIQNNEKIDPNTHFQAKLDAQYDQYSKKVGNSQRGTFTKDKMELSKVNEEADFDENYHKFRKEADMQSTIFYEPSISNSRLTERSRITERFVPKHAYNVEDLETNFGKKETLNREIKTQPENVTQFTGNSSNIFGYDEHSERNGVKNKVDKLIPHQMQWNNHDSVKHQDFNQEKHMPESISESASQLFSQLDKQEICSKINEMKIIDQASKENDPQMVNVIKKELKTNTEEPKKGMEKPKTTINQNKVEINILKGWNSSLMEDLSKYCRLNSTKILTVNFEEGGKGNLILERSKKWENVTDWLRKDAKLKIRVFN